MSVKCLPIATSRPGLSSRARKSASNALISPVVRILCIIESFLINLGIERKNLYVSPVVFDIVYKENLFLVYLNLVKPCKTLGYRVNDFSCLHFY